MASKCKTTTKEQQIFELEKALALTGALELFIDGYADYDAQRQSAHGYVIRKFFHLSGPQFAWFVDEMFEKRSGE